MFHAPLVAAAPGLELAAIVTRDPERARQAVDEHPAASVLGDAAELWTGVDVVVVATPNRAHVPLARAALAHGLAVVIDKPLAPSAAAAEELLAAGGRLTVFQNRRWDGDFLTARRLVEEGTLGRVLRFESRFERFRPEVAAGAWRESADVEEGGGLLLDLGTHLVDQARVLLGDPVAVYAEIDARRPGAGVDDDVFLALEHADGARSHLWMSSTAPLHGPRLRVSGLRAGFATRGLDPQEGQLAAGLRPGDAGFGEAPPGALRDAGVPQPVPLVPGAYDEFYARVPAWARDEAPPPVDPADALAVLRVLEAARRSGRERTVVPL